MITIDHILSIRKENISKTFFYVDKNKIIIKANLNDETMKNLTMSVFFLGQYCKFIKFIRVLIVK